MIGFGGDDDRCGTNIGSPEARHAWEAQSALVDQGWTRNDEGMYVSPDGGQELSPIQVNEGGASSRDPGRHKEEEEAFR